MQLQSIDLDLDVQTGLPDALRVLLEEFPRSNWETDPGYVGLIQFWLERHMMFRRLIEHLKSDSELALDNQLEHSQYQQNLSRLGSMFVQELHNHHTIEDQHYFPALAKLDSRIQPGFDILDRDHNAIDPLLEEFVGCANAVLNPASATDTKATATLHAHITKLEQLLNRHLIDEEELVVPVVLKHGFE